MKSRNKNRNGNVVLGHQSSDMLKLDCDMHVLKNIKEFAIAYTKFYDLGSIMVFKTSDHHQLDFNLEPLGNFAVIFGKIRLSQKEIKWHLKQVYELGYVDKSFYAIRRFGSITIRNNRKNSEIPAPEPVFYFPNGDNRGIKAFLRLYRICKELG